MVLSGESPQKSTDTYDAIPRELIRKRGVLKGRLTKFTKFVNSLDSSVALTDQKREDLKLRIQGAANLFCEFNSVQSRIEECAPESDIDEQLTLRESFEDIYYNTVAIAECAYNFKSEPIINHDEGNNTKHTNSHIKMPTIRTPTFDGSCEDWLEYRDTFVSLVHSSKDISDIQKFHYLRSSLKGSAALVINSVQFSSDNYNVAWELLLNRFNNSRLLTQSHVKSLFTMNVLNKESPVLIKTLIDNVLKNLRALSILGEPTEHWDTLLIYLIVSKLDITTEREWEQKKGDLLSSKSDSKLNIQDLINFLKNRADMLESLQLSHGKQSNYKVIMHNNNKIHAHVTNTKPQQYCSYNQHKKLCLACNSNHPIYSCQKFHNLNLESKLSLIKKNNLCINCLRSGYTVNNCKLGSCRLCNKKHNTLVHNSDESTQSVSNHLKQPAATFSQVTDTHNTDNSIQTIQANKAHIEYDKHTTYSSSNQPVLLSIAEISVADSQNIYYKAHALLDSGSQRSFITQSLCNKLNIPLIQSTQEIRGVGNSVIHSTQSCQIKFKSHNHQFSTQIQCFVLPNITSTLPAITCARSIDIPNNIQLANPEFYKCHKIDLLLGADLFWDLLKTDRIRLSSGPILQDTHLGWIISGPVKNYLQNNHINCNFSQSIETHLRQFWELEELPRSGADKFTPEERACEELYVKTTTRGDDGRFSTLQKRHTAHVSMYAPLTPIQLYHAIYYVLKARLLL
ncbi:uncharacterized protein LOC119188381 isoform X2 [Manduca sexta]|uniref:uncharacterized protein LOC119188381 isoform X2 n=1 Tax=Manduca sexta TaxID=7130 RepID=UPI00188F60E3|nr:uncharacterized protein LOC119188381 isoform X2 [Manduca sexta]XP_037295966.1 uncharacterized protein LOC119188381 isoform X2 [Manduca sexta]